MATPEQILEYLKRKRGGAEQLPTPIPPSTFDIGVSKSTPTAIPLAPEDPIKLKSLAPSPAVDIDQILSSPPPPPLGATRDWETTKEETTGVPPPEAVSPTAPAKTPTDLAIEAALAKDEKPATDGFKGGVRAIGQGFAGLADAMSARAGIKSNAMASAIKASQAAEAAGEGADLKDPSSAISATYRKMLARYTGKNPEDYARLTAERIKPLIGQAGKEFEFRETAKAKEGVGIPQTEGEKKVDQLFANDYQEWVGGGFSDSVSQIKGLSTVLAQLKDPKGANLTGAGLSMLPDFARKRTFSASMEAQQLVEQSVQRTLKKTLGGQFTEKEGILFMQRGYDPALSEEANARKLEGMIAQLKKMVEAKQQAVDYFRKNGTLKGFTGLIPTLEGGTIKNVPATTEGIRKMMDPTGGQAGQPEVGAIDDGYRFKGGDPSDPNNWEAE